MAISKKQVETIEEEPKKQSIATRIFTFKYGFSHANINEFENYAHSSQNRLIADGYQIIDRSATGNMTVYSSTIKWQSPLPQFAMHIDNGGVPVLIFAADFTAYEQFMLRYGLLTPFIECWLP